MDLKECLAQEYTVDWGNPFNERTVYIKVPTQVDDFDEGEERMFLTENYIKEHITFESTTDPIKLEICVTALFKLLKTEPTFRVSAIVNIHGLAYDADEMQNTKEKLVAILVHRVKTYYEGKDIDIRSIKEEEKMAVSTPDSIHIAFGCTTRTPTNKPKRIEGLPAVDKVETYNNRVVKVTFIDGTFTKAVCSENDNFDLDMGITICAMKRLLGTNSENATREYNRFINHVHSVMEKNALKELAEEAQKAKEKQKQRKAELKRAAKKLKAREEQIDIQKQAIIRAQKELEAEDQ